MKLNQLTIYQAIDGLKKKRFSSEQLTQACLDRIKKVEKKINAFITVCEEGALAEAKNKTVFNVLYDKYIYKS